MKPCALFLSNEIYFDSSKKEGGVRVCTEEYLALIQVLYNVELFTVGYHLSLAYRLRVKFGLNIYHDYKPEQYSEQLASIIIKMNVEVVFLNLSNTVPFAAIIKSVFGDKVKVVLCSHGNESGDFLHESTRFQQRIPAYRSWLSAYTLGNMLKKEAAFRQQDLDAVLTVSPVEEALENWLGAKQVLMVPRTVKKQFLTRTPISGRVGFIGDLSHWPNYYGIDEVCKALAALPVKNGIDLRLVGSPASIGEQLAATYSFVSYLGYVNNDALQAEAASWSFFLNPVFYYSRGVSTKLAKAFGWGIPVITTRIGFRGYVWKRGSIVVAETPADMAQKIHQYAIDTGQFQNINKEIEELIYSTPGMHENAAVLKQFIDRLY